MKTPKSTELFFCRTLFFIPARIRNYLALAGTKLGRNENNIFFFLHAVFTSFKYYAMNSGTSRSPHTELRIATACFSLRDGGQASSCAYNACDGSPALQVSRKLLSLISHGHLFVHFCRHFQQITGSLLALQFLVQRRACLNRTVRYEVKDIHYRVTGFP